MNKVDVGSKFIGNVGGPSSTKTPLQGRKVDVFVERFDALLHTDGSAEKSGI